MLVFFNASQPRRTIPCKTVEDLPQVLSVSVDMPSRRTRVVWSSTMSFFGGWDGCRVALLHGISSPIQSSLLTAVHRVITRERVRGCVHTREGGREDEARGAWVMQPMLRVNRGACWRTFQRW